MVWIKWFIYFFNYCACDNGGFSLYRMKVRMLFKANSAFTPIPAITPAGLELDPDTPATLDENQLMKL